MLDPGELTAQRKSERRSVGEFSLARSLAGGGQSGCSVQALTGLAEAHPHQGGRSIRAAWFHALMYVCVYVSMYLCVYVSLYVVLGVACITNRTRRNNGVRLLSLGHKRYYFHLPVFNRSFWRKLAATL